MAVVGQAEKCGDEPEGPAANEFVEGMKAGQEWTVGMDMGHRHRA